MHVVTNSVSPTQVQETDGAYIIEDVPFLKPMALAGGYVPRANVRETASDWVGVPVTLNHPRNDAGEPIAANQRPDLHLGTVSDTRFGGEHVRGDIRIEKTRLEDVGGEALDIEAALDNGHQIDVSSQYLSEPLPAGEYDGEHRANVERITRPDSLAILPNQQGRCSLADGCGINPQMAANSAFSIPMTHSANATHDGEDMDAAADPDFAPGDLVAWDWSGGTAQGRVAGVFVDEGIVTRTFDGTEVSKDSDDAPVYLVDVWRGDGFEGQALRQAGQRNFRAWDDPPDEAMSANATAYELTDVAPDEIDGWTDAEWDGDAAVAAMPNPSEDEGAPDVLDQTHAAVPADADARDTKSAWKLPFRSGPDAPVNTRALVAIDAALSGARGGVEGLRDVTQEAIAEWTDAMLAAAPDDLFGTGDDDDQSANIRAAGQKLATIIPDILRPTQHSAATMPAESGADGDHLASNDATVCDTMDPEQRERLVNEITSNSAITADSLSDACDERVELLHGDVVANDTTASTSGADDTDTDTDMSDNTDTDNDTGTDDTVGLDDLSDEAVSKLEDRVASRIKANRADERKADLAAQIVANSNEYDDADTVREDYPTEAALETKLDSVSQSAQAPPTGDVGGLAANDEAPDIDVSSGVLTDE